MNDTDRHPDRPDWACLLHHPPADTRPWARADDGYRTCSGCLDRLRALLADIRTRYTKLDPRPGANTEHGSRGAPGFRSTPAASLHVIALTDPRSSADAHVWLGADGRVHFEAEHPPLSVVGVLDTLAWDIAEQRGIDGPTRITVDDLTRWIDAHLDWLTRQPLVIDAAAQLRRLAAQLRPVTGDARRRIGTCPNTLDEGDTTRLCEAPLHAPTNGSDTITCGACGRSWPRSEWLRLGDLLAASCPRQS